MDDEVDHYNTTEYAPHYRPEKEVENRKRIAKVGGRKKDLYSVATNLLTH